MEKDHVEGQDPGSVTIGSLRFATRGLKTAYRSLDASAVKGIPLFSRHDHNADLKCKI